MNIIYIFHNSFILQTGDTTILFDYPNDQYINKEISNLVIEQIKDRNLFAFVSHGHADHFNPQIAKFAAFAAASRFIISSDVRSSYRLFKDPPGVLWVKPDQEHSLEGLAFRTFKSNDRGVAFLMNLSGMSIYFGGDLADWSWDDFTQRQRNRINKIFRATLAELKKSRIHIAFSNIDPRLSNCAGSPEFIAEINPELFVPMHAFGNLAWVHDFASQTSLSGNVIFDYRFPGDNLIIKDKTG
jgi:hypothetical protein